MMSKLYFLLMLSMHSYALETSRDIFIIKNEMSSIKISSEIDNLIFDVIQQYNDKNSLGLESLINQNIGLYFIIDPIHSVRSWNTKKICFNTCYEEYFNLSYFYKVFNSEKLLENKYILKNIYLRDSINKNGRLFKVMSRTIERLRINGDLDKNVEKKLIKELSNIEKWEKDSIEVILVNQEYLEESEFRFFLTKIINKWYLTIIDYIPTNIFTRIYINNQTHKSLYSFCKTTGIKESEIRALNPWINEKATNIPPNAEIIVPNLSKEENNESK